MNYSAEQIERIIDDFYSPTSSLSVLQRQQFNDILEKLQHSPTAWEFSWTLLDLRKPASVQFFGAVALCNKICKNLSELDDAQRQQLCQQLIHRLTTYIAANSKQIIVKLTVALSHLILQMITTTWNGGLTTVVTLFTQPQNEFLAQHPEKGHLIALNILTTLPEEFPRLTIPKSQCSAIRLELEKEFPTVLNYVQFIICTYTQVDILRNVFTCLSRWLEFGIPIVQVEVLLDYLFHSLANEQLFNDAADCLVALFSSPDAFKYPTTFSRLMPHILSLETLLDQCILTRDKEKTESVTKLITQFGENLAQLIVQLAVTQNPQAQSFCRLVLKCTDMKGQYPVDETSSELTFHFWHALKEEMNSSNDNAILLDLLRPYFEHLIEILINKNQMPLNENVFSSEDRETFQSYRTSVFDAMMTMYDVLGYQAMEVLANQLSTCIEHNPTWQKQESILHLIGAGREYMQSPDNLVLPRIFALIPKLNFCNNLIIKTTLTVIGYYSSWLGMQPEMLQSCVRVCINGLANADLIEPASIALKELIKDNRLYMSKYLQEIFPIMKGVLENVHVQPDDRIRCVSIVGYILPGHSAQLVLEYLNALLAPEWNKLLSCLNDTGGHQSDAVRQEKICTTLNFISVLIASIGCYSDANDADGNAAQSNASNTTEVLCYLLRDLDRILRMILQRYADDIPVTEKICEILSRTVTILRDASMSILDTFLQLLQTMGPNILHSEFLSFVRNTLLLFANNSDNSVCNLFMAVLQKFGRLFNAEWLKNHVDTVEDVANFFAQVLKKLPNVVHHCPDEAFALLFQFMKSGIQLHEQGPVKSISGFACNLIEYTKLNQRAAELFQPHGLEFVQILLQCIGGASPRHLLESVSLPLFTLSKSHLQWTIQWVQQCLNDPNFPTPAATRQHRETLLKIISAERTNRSGFKDHINKFASACREPLSKDNLS